DGDQRGNGRSADRLVSDVPSEFHGASSDQCACWSGSRRFAGRVADHGTPLGRRIGAAGSAGGGAVSAVVPAVSQDVRHRNATLDRVRYGVVGSLHELAEAGEGCGKGDHAEVEVAVAFVARAQAAEPGQPGEGAFDHPSVASEALGRFDAFAGDPGDDPARPEGGAAVVVVVALVGVLTGRRLGLPKRCLIGWIWSTVRSSRRLSWTFAPEIWTLKGRPFRSTVAWIFVPGLPRSTGLGPVWSPPDLARMLIESIAARDQSIAAEVPSRLWIACSRSSQKPARVQAVKRSWPVDRATPKAFGRSRQEQPVRSR